MEGTEGQAAAGGGWLLAGHADREQVIQVLKDAFVQDRLTRDELDVRAGRALTARTRAELSVLTADIPGYPAAGPPRPPAAARPGLARRRPLVWAFAGSGSCLAIGFGLLAFNAHVLDPNGFGHHPYQPWSTLSGLVASVALITAFGILVHGVGTVEEQWRARKDRAGSSRSLASGRRLMR
jgi:hypothetical protein